MLIIDIATATIKLNTQAREFSFNKYTYAIFVMKYFSPKYKSIREF